MMRFFEVLGAIALGAALAFGLLHGLDALFY